MVLSKYNCEITPFPSDGRNYLVLVNHQSDVDQFVVSSVFSDPVYFVAMEDLFSRGLFSRFLRWAAEPIPILKGRNDAASVRRCMRVAKEGGTVVLFPEGNRTYNGRTCYIGPQVAKFVKLLRLPVAILKIEGGYGVKPRWADEMRNGSMKGSVSRVIEPDEYLQMDNDSLYELICSELAVDDTREGRSFSGLRIAEGLERVLYYCPECKLTSYETRADMIRCTKCGKTYRLLPNQQLVCPDGGSPFKRVTDWYDAQESYVKSLDLGAWSDIPAYEDTVKLYEVVLYKNKKQVEKDCVMYLYGDRIEISRGKSPFFGETDDGVRVWRFDEVSAMTCVGDHKLNVYMDSIGKDAETELFQIVGNKHFNALKYCNFYYHYRFVNSAKSGDMADEFQFLGL